MKTTKQGYNWRREGDHIMVIPDCEPNGEPSDDVHLTLDDINEMALALTKDDEFPHEPEAVIDAGDDSQREAPGVRTVEGGVPYQRGELVNLSAAEARGLGLQEMFPHLFDEDGEWASGASFAQFRHERV